ncbi:ATP-binding protein [Metallibacterium scheffleri]
MTEIDVLLTARERLWNEHPVIMETGAFPTRAVQDATARVMRLARKGRASIAFWADPLVGKSTCIKAITRAIHDRFPDAGTLLLESVEDRQPAEGRVLLDILKAIGYAPKVDRELSGKRDQVRRGLLGLSGPAKHLFIIVDEAQEISNAEFGWFKAVINKQVGLGVKATTVLFGQRELRKRKEDLEQDGRSDLAKRFMANMREFCGLRSKVDLDVICEVMDVKSEFPEGSGWTYSGLLFPRAYQSGFRFMQLSPQFWEAITTAVPPSELRKGISMEIVAGFIANLCILLKNKDAEGLEVASNVITKALQSALVADSL